MILVYEINRKHLNQWGETEQCINMCECRKHTVNTKPLRSHRLRMTQLKKEMGRGLGFWEKGRGHGMYTAARVLLPHSEGV